MSKSSASPTARKPKSSKSAPRRPKAQTPPAPSPEEKAAAEVLKLVDKAAGLLRQGIEEGARTSAAVRGKAHKQAHSLLHRAVNSLDELASGTTAVLHSAINRTLGRPKR